MLPLWAFKSSSSENFTFFCQSNQILISYLMPFADLRVNMTVRILGSRD